jgi:hypothetical protein
VGRVSAATFDSDLLPDVDNSRSIGDSTTKWQTVSISKLLNLGVLDDLNSDINFPSPTTGSVYYNPAKNKIRVYDGADWTDVGNQWAISGNDISYNTGNVGIGATIPGAKLEVVGDIISKGTVWTPRNSTVGGYSVVYGNGVFVVVTNGGAANKIMISSDGINWKTSSAVDNNWTSVTYGNGLFVAVASSGTGNRVMTSPDGINWTTRISAADISWTSVTYGNGLFVAVSGTGTGNNRVMTSPDGMNWTIRSAAIDDWWTSITYGNGLFAAVSMGNSASRVMTSPDGITWTIRAGVAPNAWSSITYGNGLFVAVSGSGAVLTNRVMTSYNGIAWNPYPAASSNQWQSVTYGNGLFVAVSNSGTGNRVMTSPDGMNWTSRTTPDNNWSAVAYGNGVFAAVATTNLGAGFMMSSGRQESNLVIMDNVFHSIKIVDGNQGLNKVLTSDANGLASWQTPSSSSSSTIPFTAGMDITAGQAVYIHTDGKVYSTDAADNALTATYVGFASENITGGNVGNVQIFGKVTGLAGLTVGSVYYLKNATQTAQAAYNGAGADNSNLEYFGGSENFYQSFKPTNSQISKVEIGIYNNSVDTSNITLRLTIRSGTGIGGAIVATKDITVSQPPNNSQILSFYLNSPLNVTVGNTYTISLYGISGSYGGEQWAYYYDTLVDNYPDGKSERTDTTTFYERPFTAYYSTTRGALNASPGTVSKKAGIATSATELLLKE